MKAPAKKKCVLVVDDEKEICDMVQKILTLEGYHILTARSGLEAIRHLKAHPVDLMMVDLKMPVMDGLEVLKRARLIHKDLRTILLTAYGTASAAREAMQLGVYDFLTKPFDNRLLKKVVKETLHDMP